jgi:aspartate aminotransferase-like enzyme
MTSDDRCTFFIPGPTWVRPVILQELTRPMIGHRSSEFREVFVRINADLKSLFETKQMTFVVTSTGTGVMQAALESCVARRVLVTTCGAFSEKWFAIAESLGYEADRLSADWGQAVDPDALADHLAGRRAHYDAVTITQNETSTGISNDVATLARVVREESPDTLVLVDSVSALAGMPLQFDDWDLDVCLASVQKCLALPPGITVTAMSNRAMDKAKKHPYRGTYLDLVQYATKAAEEAVPSTPSIPHFFALARQLDDILRRETLPARFERHTRMRDITLERTAPFAEVAGDREHASPTVTALKPQKRSAESIRGEMKKRGFTLGGGYGEWKESTFRIGHMGDISIDSLNAMLDVLDEVAGA